MPYSWFVSMERLFSRETPELHDVSWLSMKDGLRTINEEEHAEIADEVRRTGWYECFSAYLKKDCVLVLASVLVMDELYQSEFGVQMLSCCYTSAGAVMTSHLESEVNRAGVEGFCRIFNATVAKTLMHARLGGIVESRARKCTTLVESEDGAAPASIVGLDLNQLYPSMNFLYSNPYGEYTFYSDRNFTGILKASSNANPYGQEYRAIMMAKHAIEARGETVLSMFSNYTNERRCLLAWYYPDATIFSRKSDGSITITLVMYDGWYHVRDRDLHHRACIMRRPGNDMENSPYYTATLERLEKSKARCEAVFGEEYDLRFFSLTDCVFHSPFPTADGVENRNMDEAFERIRLEKPELCLSARHKPILRLAELCSSEPTPDGSLLSGFVVYK